MASNNERSRALARAKRDRQLARRAVQARRRRQALAAAGTATAVALLVVGAVWFFRGGDGAPAAGADCAWTPLDTAAAPKLADVGQPPTRGVPDRETTPMTLYTSVGDLNVTLDQATAPCGVASLRHLAGKRFYDNTACHELTAETLRCGDPTGTGEGGPTYGGSGENVPAPGDPAAAGSPAQYLRGTVALVRDRFGTYGSQFVIVHKDLRTSDPALAVVGYLDTGMGLVDRVVRAGAAPGGTRPRTPLTLKALRVDDRVIGPPETTAPSPTASR